jgi:alcohol dehydrogenase class IV
MARALGDPDVPAAVHDLAVSIDAPTSLAAIGMPADRLDEAARLIVEHVTSNPRPVDLPAMRGLLADAFEGRRASLGQLAGRA